MKVLVLFSGGLDSTTCLFEAINKFGPSEVMALSAFYGQRHHKELECAKKITDKYHIKHQIIDLGIIFEESNCSLLECSKTPIPHEEYEKQLTKTNGKPVSTYVPFRNGLFLSAAASIAIANDCEVIYYGAHADDAAGNAYPDTSIKFNQAMSEAIYLGSGEKVKIVAPFINKNKADVVKRGLELKVPFELTWSCYEGDGIACGTCGTCLDRKKAFSLNGIVDPIPYKE